MRPDIEDDLEVDFDGYHRMEPLNVHTVALVSHWTDHRGRTYDLDHQITM